MTKKKTDVLETLKKNCGRKGSGGLKDRDYVVSEDGDVNIKLAPQAINCLEILFGIEGGRISEKDLFAMFDTDPVKEKFVKSKQTPWKIFQYYRRSLVEAGFLAVEKNEKVD